MRGFSDLPKKETFLDLIYCSSPLEIRTSLDRTSTLVLELIEVCVEEFVLLLQSVLRLARPLNPNTNANRSNLFLRRGISGVSFCNGIDTVFLTVLVTTLVVLLVIFCTEGGI